MVKGKVSIWEKEISISWLTKGNSSRDGLENQEERLMRLVTKSRFSKCGVSNGWRAIHVRCSEQTVVIHNQTTDVLANGSRNFTQWSGPVIWVSSGLMSPVIVTSSQFHCKTAYWTRWEGTTERGHKTFYLPS